MHHLGRVEGGGGNAQALGAFAHGGVINRLHIHVIFFQQHVGGFFAQHGIAHHHRHNMRLIRQHGNACLGQHGFYGMRIRLMLSTFGA